MHLFPNHIDDLIITAGGGGLLATGFHFLRMKFDRAKCWFCNFWSHCEGSVRWEHWYNVARESYETQFNRAEGYRAAFKRQGIIINKLKEGCRTHKNLVQVIEMKNELLRTRGDAAAVVAQKYWEAANENRNLKSEVASLKEALSRAKQEGAVKVLMEG